MKRIIITAIVAVAVQLGYAQGTTSHLLRNGDVVLRQQAAWTSAGEAGENIVWDFSNLNISDTQDEVTYEDVPARDGVIAGTKSLTRHYYAMAGDTLLSLGYESNTTLTDYGRSEALALMPLRLGNSLGGTIHGTVMYSERIMARTYGTYDNRVDGTGCMVLPSGDTLRHVTRLHLHRVTGTECFPYVNTGDSLRHIVYTACPLTDNGMAQRMATDSTLLATDTYLWYAEGYRYPILETTATGPAGQAPVSMEAYYCAPEEQVLMYDVENEQIRSVLAAADALRDANGNSPAAANGGSGILSSCVVSFSGDVVTVSYTPEVGVSLRLLLCDVSGVVYRSATGDGMSGSMALDCSGLRRGEYVLYIQAGGDIRTEKIALQ